MIIGFFILSFAVPLAAVTTSSGISGFPAIVLEKAATMFYAVDFNNDGYITEDDFGGSAGEFAHAAGLNADYQDCILAKIIPEVWNAFNIDEDGDGRPVTRDQYIELFCRVLTTNARAESDRVALQLMFETADLDHDGSMNAGEFGNLMIVFKMNPAQSAVSFAALNAGGGGGMSSGVFINHFIDYFYNQKESVAGTFLIVPDGFGPYSSPSPDL